jgi:LmbE family N-acetylglucosaminyl deacetylase
MDAVFPYARDHLTYPELSMEGLKPHKVTEILFWAPDNPNYCSDVTDTFEIKMTALQCHKSQVGRIPRELLEQWLRDRCKDMAEGKDFELAEAFHQAVALY